MPGHIPFGKADAWLRAHRSIWLATTRPDGRPHAVPLWFVWDGRAVYFNTDPTTQKYRNLSAQPWAILHLGDGDDTVIVEGKAAVVTDPDELRRVDAAYRKKYVDPHSGATAGYPESETSMPFRLDVSRIMAWEYGVVLTRTDFLPGGPGIWHQRSPAKI